MDRPMQDEDQTHMKTKKNKYFKRKNKYRHQ